MFDVTKTLHKTTLLSMSNAQIIRVNIICNNISSHLERGKIIQMTIWTIPFVHSLLSQQFHNKRKFL